MRGAYVCWGAIAWAVASAACSGSDSASLAPTGGTGGADASVEASTGGTGAQPSGGSGGTAGHAGAAGTGGTAGYAGAAGTGGTAGGAGTAGTGGSATGGSGGATGGAAGTAGTAGAAGAGGTGGPAPTSCHPFGDSCSTGADCCSMSCSPTTHLCGRNILACSQPGAPCGDNTECCNLNCTAGKCQSDACVGDGKPCAAGGTACCSGTCSNGTCADVNGPGVTCLTAGNACTSSSACCSGLCENNACVLGVSQCVQVGDICADNLECCSGQCLKAAQTDTYGACVALGVGPNRCEDGLAGMICSSCGICCSRACAPGPKGVFICQPPTGCRPAGELCSTASDCCGGDPSTGLPGAGESVVTCEKLTSTDLFGRCKSQACTPQGDVCQLSGGACSASSTSLPSNCCPTYANPSNPAWKKGTCEFDSLLIPRCNGLAECVPAGGYCSTASDCCNGLPCVPDPSDGDKLKCYVPSDSGVACVDPGGPCTAGADCCPPSTCVVAPGDVFGTCGSQGTGGSGGGGTGGAGGTGGEPPEGGVDAATGGTGGQPSCAAYGQVCTQTSDCCYTSSGVQCISGHCIIQG